MVKSINYSRKRRQQRPIRIFYVSYRKQQLAKSLFPIGELTKPQAREIATQLDLVMAEKRDSQGLCFIGKTAFTRVFTTTTSTGKRTDLLNCLR